jgi:hypothetical protein
VDEIGVHEGRGVLLQQLTRFRDDDGRESIVGTLRADFVTGQRTAELYMGFCPPFDATPACEIEQSDGPPARLASGQVLPHGARIEVRLMEPARAAAQVSIDVVVHGPA